MNIWLIIMWIYLYLGLNSLICTVIMDLYDGRDSKIKEEGFGYLLFLILICLLTGPFGIAMNIKEFLEIRQIELTQTEENETEN